MSELTFDDLKRGIGNKIAVVGVALVGDIERAGLQAPMISDMNPFPRFRLFRWLP